MKALFRCLLCVILCVMLMSACLVPAFSAESFYGKAELLQMKSHMEGDAGLSQYGVCQGACTDGKYAYFAAMSGGATILKYDVNSWKLVDKKMISDVGHGNDMAYNSDDDILVIANNAPYYNIVTVVDPDSLSVIKDVELKQKVKVKEKDKNNKVVEKEVEKALNIYSIAYNSTRKQYVVGISGTYNFALLDRDFKLVKTIKGVNTGYTRQGCDCDDDYIYFVQSGSGNNILVIYDYSGNRVATVTVDHSHEIENIFHIGNSFYTSLFYYGNTLHRIGFSEATKITYRVVYDPNGGEGEMDPTVVHYGTSVNLSKNTFTRDGYSFGGWIVERGSDGKVVGYSNGAEEYGWLDKDEVYDYHLYNDAQKVSKTVKNGTVKLSAFWISDYYSIYYDSDGGEGYIEPDYVAYDDIVTVPESPFVKEGYIFDGYLASRDVDGRVYGYRKDSKKPAWLEREDMYEPYRFMPGDEMYCMTYDGSVTLTAKFKYAYTFDEDGDSLTEYIGVDETVRIPNNDGKLNTVATGAFKENDTMTELYIPACVSSIESGAVTDCSGLKSIYFEGALPHDLDGTSIKPVTPSVMYRVYDGKPLCIGILGDAESLPLIRCQAEVLDRQHAAQSE